MRIRKTDGPIYRLKVTLRGSRPPIWRRFLVPGGITLKRLHDCLQAVMGWDDAHLHHFDHGGQLYGTNYREFDSDMPYVSENTHTVAQLLCQPKDRLTYLYDFGDSWEHDVVLEAILPPAGAGDGPYPYVEAGRRACPPEDIGGVPGYEDFLAAVADPKHPQHKDVTEWLDDPFDPNAFSVAEANLDIHGGWVKRR